ncbi:Uncharacterised protein [Vibrio cholerae]|nr:Uncharacterised protein [Vibrio cholerae]
MPHQAISNSHTLMGVREKLNLTLRSPLWYCRYGERDDQWY